MRIKSLILLFAFILIITGCASTQERLLDSNQSQVKLRSIQTRTYDTTDKEKLLRSALSTLQSLNFVIDKADYTIGTITAKKLNKYALVMTVTVSPKGNKQLKVRANAQYQNKPVTDPKPYQNFFTSLEKAKFLETHNVQ